MSRRVWIEVERRVELKTCESFEVISGIMYMEKEMTIGKVEQLDTWWHVSVQWFLEAIMGLNLWPNIHV